MSTDHLARESHAESDIRNAERLVELRGDDLRYIPEQKRWLVWDGRRWRTGATEQAYALAVDTARVLLASAKQELVRRTEDHAVASAHGSNDARKNIKEAERTLRWAARSQLAPRLHAMLDVARSHAHLIVAPTNLDSDPFLLNVLNGTVDLRTGSLLPHRREELLTKLAPVPYDPDATCPRFDAFVRRVQNGDVERIAFLRQFLGYCLSGDVREHILTFWFGPGGNGKSVLAKLIMHAMGDYAVKAAPDLLFRGRTERHPTELADLHGARLVVCNETQRLKQWDEATVKDITGGDTIKARRMREDWWSYDPTFKLAVLGNHKPHFIGPPDGGIQRRLRLIPFDVTIPQDEIDRELDRKLWAEAGGVLAWLVRGCLEWQQHGLREPHARSLKHRSPQV